MTSISRSSSSALAGLQESPAAEGGGDDLPASPDDSAAEPLATSAQGLVGGLLDALPRPFYKFSPEYRHEQEAQAAMAPDVGPAEATVAQLSRPVDTAALNVLANAFTARDRRWTQPRDAHIDAAGRLDAEAGAAAMTANFEPGATAGAPSGRRLR